MRYFILCTLNEEKVTWNDKPSEFPLESSSKQVSYIAIECAVQHFTLVSHPSPAFLVLLLQGPSLLHRKGFHRSLHRRLLRPPPRHFPGTRHHLLRHQVEVQLPNLTYWPRLQKGKNNIWWFENSKSGGYFVVDNDFLFTFYYYKVLERQKIF